MVFEKFIIYIYLYFLAPEIISLLVDNLCKKSITESQDR